ncbi:MAG: RNA polymerase sigma factor [Acidimicrobiales bacterium]
MSEFEDADIVRRSLSGDPHAFRDLFWRHGGSIHAYLARRAGRDVADDLVGDVWLRAFGGRASYNEAYRDARPWLYGIARLVLLEHWRHRARPMPRIPAVVNDPWPEVDERLDVASRRIELVAALGELTEEERETLLLVAWEQLRPFEIARVLALPESTVRNRLHRARTVMREQLQQSSDCGNDE